MATKLNLYMKSGISEYWIVDLESKRINQYSFSQERDIERLNILGEGDTINSAVFDGLEIPLNSVFAEIQPVNQAAQKKSP